MPRKKKPAAADVNDFTYDDNLSIRVKEGDEKNTLHHYFGELLRENVEIDRIHKYCFLCLQLHLIKR